MFFPGYLRPLTLLTLLLFQTESQQFLQELLHRCTSDALEQLLSDLNSARFTLRDDPQRSATKERLDTFLKTYEQQVGVFKRLKF